MFPTVALYISEPHRIFEEQWEGQILKKAQGLGGMMGCVRRGSAAAGILMYDEAMLHFQSPPGRLQFVISTLPR